FSSSRLSITFGVNFDERKIARKKEHNRCVVVNYVKRFPFRFP
uniref:Uncharacterized protein n=1 Tax=Anopheles dirus TaxID=7168 RepID=A0A182NY32_9DIPT